MNQKSDHTTFDRDWKTNTCLVYYFTHVEISRSRVRLNLHGKNIITTKSRTREDAARAAEAEAAPAEAAPAEEEEEEAAPAAEAEAAPATAAAAPPSPL